MGRTETFTRFVAPYKKAIVGGLSAGIFSLIAGASEGGLSMQEWLIAIGAIIGTGGATGYVTNKPVPAPTISKKTP